jgi:hypothetical protein
MSFLLKGEKKMRFCYGSDVKCPPQMYVLKTWFLADGTISDCCGNFRRWGLSGGSRSPGVS